VIERAGHFTPLEEPRTVTDALHEWLIRWPFREASQLARQPQVDAVVGKAIM
jgi:hypothetical protein